MNVPAAWGDESFIEENGRYRWFERENTIFSSALFNKKCEFMHLSLDIIDVISGKIKYDGGTEETIGTIYTIIE